MLKNHFKIAWRNLRRQKLYASINIFGMAVGMATATLLFLWVYNELTFDNFHQKSGQIFRINAHIEFSKNETWTWGVTPLLLGPKMAEDFKEIEEFTRLFTPWSEIPLKVNNDFIPSGKVAFVDSSWFSVFDYTLREGSFENFKQNKYQIALTESKAIALFGTENALDKTIQMDSIHLVVKAILKDYPANTLFKYDIFIPIAARLADPISYKNDSSWDNFNYQTFLVCNLKTNITKLEEKMSASFRVLKNDSENSNALTLQALKEIHYDDSVEEAALVPPVSKNVIWIFAGIAFLILLTACINYINLTTATLSLRNKEVGVKKVLGIAKSGLFQQFLMETFFQTLLSLGIAIGIFSLALPFMEGLVNQKFYALQNSKVWLVLLSTAFFAFILNGVYPSFLLSTMKPLQLMKGGSVLKAGKSHFRKLLVVFQFTFTVVLLVCTLVIFQQLSLIQNRELGYNKDLVFSFTMPWNADETGSKLDAIYDRLKQEGQIVNITRSNGNIIDFNSTHSGSLDWPGKAEDWNPGVSPMSVADNYLEFFDLKLKEGRWFEATNSSDNRNVILNETAVKDFKLNEPVIGQKFHFQGREGQVIGVVKDFHYRSPRERISPLLFYRDTNWQTCVSVKVNPNNMQKAIAKAESIWNTYIPEIPFKYSVLEDTYAKMHEAEEKQLLLFYVFGGIVLLISCIGLFGLATFAIEQRVREIGIRKVLGATVLEIVNLLSKEFIYLAGIATLIASPLAWWFSQKWLQDFAYRIEISWWMFALIGFIVTLIVLITVSYQSVQAALLNPVKSLKNE